MTEPMSDSPSEGPLIWLIAGEPSGDLIGARLIAALRDRTGGRIRIAGIGGEVMAAEGLKSQFPISDIAVLGVVEIIHRIPLIKKRMRQTIAQIKSDRPAIVISIDVPGFSYEIWKGLRETGIPLIHYVAPTVWAWRPKRAKKFAAELDHLLALLPFEPPFFEREGLDCTFVGHPVLQGGADNGDGPAFRTQHGIAPDATVVCVLPGSRKAEVKRLTGLFRQASDIVSRTHPDTVYVFPTVSYLKEMLGRELGSWPGRTVVVSTIAEKFDAMAASNIAMAASGTVSLELAMARVPHLIAYRLSRLTFLVFKLLHGVRQQYANLVNILLEREAIPELLQDNCRAERIAVETLKLLEDEPVRAAQQSAMKEALGMLRPPGGDPSSAAASVVLSYLDTRPQGADTQRKRDTS